MNAIRNSQNPQVRRVGIAHRSCRIKTPAMAGGAHPTALGSPSVRRGSLRLIGSSLMVVALAVAVTDAAAVALGPGDIVVADFTAFVGFGGGVIRVDPATGAQTTVSSGGSFVDPFGIAVVPSPNTAPEATDDGYSHFGSDTPLVVALPGVLGNDTDVDGDPLSAVQVSGPSHGTLTLNPDGSFTYQPNEDFLGSDNFTYKANDGTEDSNVATVTITIGAGCNGLQATMTGTSASQTLEGTAGADVIAGLGGNDKLLGKGGNDTLCGGLGNDSLNAGSGDDYLDGGSGNDELRGDIGNDTLLGRDGADTLNGDAGADTLAGGRGRWTFAGAGPGPTASPPATAASR